MPYLDKISQHEYLNKETIQKQVSLILNQLN
jgi:hypothetical protein